MLALDSKTCTKCFLSKDFSDFHKRALSVDGLMSQCKNCVNARIKAAYDRDPAKKIAKTRQYHLDNPEWSKEVQAAWHKENREIRYERVKTRLATEPEFLSYRRKVQANSERKRRALKTATEVSHITQEQYAEVLNFYNNTCWICEQRVTNFHWDHYQPLAKSGAHTIENLRPACVPCNTRKNSSWPFTNEMKINIATEVRNLTNVKEVMP